MKNVYIPIYMKQLKVYTETNEKYPFAVMKYYLIASHILRAALVVATTFRSV